MSISEELREWAASPMNNWELSEAAWQRLCSFLPLVSEGQLSRDHRRTFALLVAEALESK